MATITKRQLEYKGHALATSSLALGSHPSGADPGKFLEGAGQSWTRNAPLIASSGKLVIATADSQAVVGFAAAAASGTTDTAVTMAGLAVPGALIEANLLEAAAADHVLAQADILAAYALQVDSGNFYLNQGETGVTNVFARVIRPVGGDGGVMGDTNARVLAMVIASAWTNVYAS